MRDSRAILLNRSLNLSQNSPGLFGHVIATKWRGASFQELSITVSYGGARR
jgi:hypothetical protein